MIIVIVLHWFCDQSYGSTLVGIHTIPHVVFVIPQLYYGHFMLAFDGSQAFDLTYSLYELFILLYATTLIGHLCRKLELNLCSTISILVG